MVLFAPAGLCLLQAFEPIGQRPVWRWCPDQHDVEQTVWMPYGENRTCLRLHNRRTRSLTLRWRPFAPMCWFHDLTRDGSAAVEVVREVGDCVRISSPSSPHRRPDRRVGLVFSARGALVLECRSTRRAVPWIRL